MKKTTLLLLSSVSLIAGCYSSPEMNQNRYEQMYLESSASCRQAEESYQHKGLRSCLEARIAKDNAQKKTVQIIPNPDGMPLVVPKTYDDVLMMEENRVYEVVDANSNTVIVNDSVANVEDFGIQNETTTYTTVTEVIERDDDVVEDIETVEDIKIIETVVVPATNEPPIVFTEDETLDVPTEDETVVVSENVETVTVTDIDAKEVPEDTDDEGCPTDQADDCVIEEEVEVVDECAEACDDEKVITTQETTTTTISSSSGNAEGVKGLTLVMGPLNEELVISVKSAPRQEERQVVETKKTIEDVKTVETTQKIEKEVLPSEEK